MQNNFNSNSENLTELFKQAPMKRFWVPKLHEPDYYLREKIAGSEKRLEMSLDLFGQIGGPIINTHPSRNNVIVNGVVICDVYKQRSESDIRYKMIWGFPVWLTLEDEKKLHILINELCRKHNNAQRKEILDAILTIAGLTPVSETEIESEEEEIQRKIDEKLKAKAKRNRAASRSTKPLIFYYPMTDYEWIQPRIISLKEKLQLNRKEEVLIKLINYYDETQNNPIEATIEETAA